MSSERYVNWLSGLCSVMITDLVCPFVNVQLKSITMMQEEGQQGNIKSQEACMSHILDFEGSAVHLETKSFPVCQSAAVTGEASVNPE